MRSGSFMRNKLSVKFNSILLDSQEVNSLNIHNSQRGEEKGKISSFEEIFQALSD